MYSLGKVCEMMRNPGGSPEKFNSEAESMTTLFQRMISVDSQLRPEAKEVRAVLQIIEQEIRTLIFEKDTQ